MWVRIPVPTGSPRLLPGRCTVGCPLLQVCTLGWVKCREHISLLIILCIIVYVTNKAHPSLICIVVVVFLLDAPISQSGLFGEAVSSVVEKFRSAKTQSAALKQFMPRRTRDHSTSSSSLSREQSLPRKEPFGRSGAQATHPPPTTVWGARGRSFPRQRPRRRVDLKRPNRPAASANPGRS